MLQRGTGSTTHHHVDATDHDPVANRVDGKWVGLGTATRANQTGYVQTSGAGAADDSVFLDGIVVGTPLRAMGVKPISLHRKGGRDVTRVGTLRAGRQRS